MKSTLGGGRSVLLTWKVKQLTCTVTGERLTVLRWTLAKEGYHGKGVIGKKEMSERERKRKKGKWDRAQCCYSTTLSALTALSSSFQ